MVEHINSKRLQVLQVYLDFQLWQFFEDKCSMALMPHKYGGHDDKYGKVT